MIRLYTAPTPNGRKISIALEELGLDYEVEHIVLDGKHKQSPFLDPNPNHKIPVLKDDELVIWESGAILLHLGEVHDPKQLILSKDPNLRMAAIQSASSRPGASVPIWEDSARLCAR